MDFKYQLKALINIKNILVFVFRLHLEKIRIKESHFILILSFVTGVFSAISCILLKTCIHIVQYYVGGVVNIFTKKSYFICPVVGILLSGLFVMYFVRDNIEHGITKILIAISKRRGRLKIHNLWTSLIASSITIGLGGSVGSEAPSVLTGAAIGSNLGRLFKMDQKTLILLISCGSAGAIAGIFKAPIAGLLFTIEVLMLDLTNVSVLPLLISSITAASISYFFTGINPIFKFNQVVPYDLKNLPCVLLLGVICGLAAIFFIRILNWIENLFSSLRNYWQRFVIGALILSIIIFLFPPLYGEGYDVINKIINNQHNNVFNTIFFTNLLNTNNYYELFFLFIFIFFSKIFVIGATVGGGGCGGIFAPSLFLGCFIGFIFSHLFNFFLGKEFFLSEENFSLIGMAGMMSSILHAPLTSIFLIAELTGGFNLFLPLMIVSSSSYFTILFFEKYNIHSMRLAKEGKLLTHNKDHAVLTLLNINTLIESDFKTVSPEMTLRDVVKIVAQSNRNIYPVIDSNGILHGIVLLDDIRSIIFRSELYDQYSVERFMICSLTKIRSDMSMVKIMNLFEDDKVWNLPVVDKEGRYIGMISKSKIFSFYRNVLQNNFEND
ncbi:MAG: chloride channel protein [Bacteroidales bacterium OttesenSCG-928-I14]|jgi:CIC family chloride channel protein|nr:chloride channel protein [Bacteroidales bacterium OttesenSCG-928-I14]